MESQSHLQLQSNSNSMEITLQTFNHLKQDLKLILGDNLFEIIIHGSYALNDFRPGLGDLDYMVVTNENLDNSTNSRLFELHDRYRSERELLLHQLEGTFYPKHFLRELSLPFVGCSFLRMTKPFLFL